jgi:hypothetical protein
VDVDQVARDHVISYHVDSRRSAGTLTTIAGG